MQFKSTVVMEYSATSKVYIYIYMAKEWKLKAQEVNAGIRKGNEH